MDDISIAICVVFFNKAEQTIETIDNLVQAGIPVYVLNNGSSETATVAVKKHCLAVPNVKYIENPQNSGCGGGRNILTKEATEDWLFFVDNDITIPNQHWLENLKKHILHSRDIDVFVPRILNVWDKMMIRPVRLLIENDKAVFLNIDSEFTNVFPGGGSVVDRRVLERLGYYDEELLAFEDFELALRAIVRGQELCVKHIQDIELKHDHRIVRSPDDHQAVRIRYDVDRVGRAHDKVERVYGVSFDKNYAEWLDDQIKDMTVSRWRRQLTKKAVLQSRRMNTLVRLVIKKILMKIFV